jgi:hypothetical protein
MKQSGGNGPAFVDGEVKVVDFLELSTRGQELVAPRQASTLLPSSG